MAPPAPPATPAVRVEIRETQARWRARFDPYHTMLTLSWPRFFAVLAGFFFSLNVLFACAYWLAPGSVANARPGSFVDVLFFSIETLATVGYGEMAPASLAGHVIASTEILIGLMSLAVVTGLVFARFSKPTARVLFSNRMVVRDFDGERVLMVRAANERHNRIVEPTAQLSLVRRERSREGEVYFRIHDLPLKRSRNPVFALTWTLVHPIDAASPLYGWDAQSLHAAQSRVIVSLVGHDETLAASVHALHEYGMEAILFEQRFVDLFSDATDGHRVIDLTRFHATEPCPPARGSDA